MSTNSRFDIFPTPLSGLMVVHRQAITDERGFFSRFYCAEELKVAGLSKPIAQINHTFTQAEGAVRGLHFQYPPHAEVKMVSCLQGKVFDVAVDLRQGSPTFLHWYGEILSAENSKSLLIPEGFAHGFQTLVGGCELLYLHTHLYAPEAEGALNVADPRLNISWPMPVTELSHRDSSHPFIDSKFSGIVL